MEKGNLKSMHPMGKAINRILNIQIGWRNQNTVYLEIPLILAVALTLWLMPWSLIAWIVPFFMGIRPYLNVKTKDLLDFIYD